MIRPQLAVFGHALTKGDIPMTDTTLADGIPAAAPEPVRYGRHALVALAFQWERTLVRRTESLDMTSPDGVNAYRTAFTVLDGSDLPGGRYNPAPRDAHLDLSSRVFRFDPRPVAVPDGEYRGRHRAVEVTGTDPMGTVRVHMPSGLILRRDRVAGHTGAVKLTAGDAR